MIQASPAMLVWSFVVFTENKKKDAVNLSGKTLRGMRKFHGNSPP